MDPIDFENMTDEQVRLAKHPIAAWVIIVLMLIGGLLGVLVR